MSRDTARALEAPSRAWATLAAAQAFLCVADQLVAQAALQGAVPATVTSYRDFCAARVQLIRDAAQ